MSSVVSHRYYKDHQATMQICSQSSGQIGDILFLLPKEQPGVLIFQLPILLSVSTRICWPSIHVIIKTGIVLLTIMATIYRAYSVSQNAINILNM